MKSKALKYLLVVVFLGCQNSQVLTKEYGNNRHENKDYVVSLSLKDYDNFGSLSNRIREIACNDSTPMISIQQDHKKTNIYPLEDCIDIIFDPKEKHYIIYNKGSFYRSLTGEEITSHSLARLSEKDFLAAEDEVYENYLIIIEAKQDEKINKLDSFLFNITDIHDNLNKDLEVNIIFEKMYLSTPEPVFE